MTKAKNKRIFINILLGLLTLVLQFDGWFINIKYDIYPLIPLAFTVVVSMYASELSAFICGMVIGIFVDASSSVHYSFNTILYPLIAFFVSLLVHYLFNNNIRSCIVISFFAAVLLLSLRFVVSYPLIGFNNLFRHFLNSVVPSALLTSIFSILFFYIEKKIFKTLR